MEKLQNIGKDSHGRDIGPRARSLDNERSLIVPVGRDGNDIVTSPGSCERMLNRDFHESGFR